MLRDSIRRFQPGDSLMLEPLEYNEMYTQQHPFVREADMIIRELVFKKLSRSQAGLEIVELGCGPGRLTPYLLTSGKARLTALDSDAEVVPFAKGRLREYSSWVDFVTEDLKTYEHRKPVDIFVSQLVHHVISRGESHKMYLKNLKTQMTDAGIYILADEFIGDYESDLERQLRSVMWHTYVTGFAQQAGYHDLGSVKADQLLNDLHYATPYAMNRHQKKLILNSAKDFYYTVEEGSMRQVEEKAQQLTQELRKLRTPKPRAYTGMAKRPVVHKICGTVLYRDLARNGFDIENVYRVGPQKKIGGMYVYVLRRKGSAAKRWL